VCPGLGGAKRVSRLSSQGHREVRASGCAVPELWHRAWEREAAGQIHGSEDVHKGVPDVRRRGFAGKGAEGGK